MTFEWCFFSFPHFVTLDVHQTTIHQEMSPLYATVDAQNLTRVDLRFFFVDTAVDILQPQHSECQYKTTIQSAYPPIPT